MEIITTHDHQKIKELVELKGGRPAVLADPTTARANLGLRIDFPGERDEVQLSETKESAGTDWHHFFMILEEQKLDLVYDPEEEDLSLAFRFIKRGNEKLEEDATVAEFQEAIQGSTESNFAAEKGVSESGSETLNDAMGPDVLGEQNIAGSTPDLSSDDDTTQTASDLGLLELDDPQIK